MADPKGEFGLWNLDEQKFVEVGMTYGRANMIAAYERDDVCARQVCPDHLEQRADECQECPPLIGTPTAERRSPNARRR